MKAYRTIRERIEKIWDEMSAVEAGKILKARWHIGGAIVEVDHDRNRALYGEEILAKLSQDLTEKFGPGFSTRNLRLMRAFHEKYSPGKLKRTLTWTHYCQLLEVRNDTHRKKLEDKAAQLHWSVETLQREVKALRRNGQTLELPRPEGDLFVYRMGLGKLGDRIDCGFSVGAKIPGMKTVKPGGIVRVTATKQGYGFEEIDDLEEPPYLYQCKLDRVIDGDTLAVYVDLGFGLNIKQKLRLNYVDAPELPTKAGHRSKKFVEDKLKGCRKLIIQTRKNDKWDRYMASVLYRRGETAASKILLSGKFLNQELLDGGKAIYATG